MPKSILKQIRLLIFVGLTVLFLLYAVTNPSVFEPLKTVSWQYGVAIGLIDFAAICVNGLFIKLILQPFQKTIATGEAVYISLLSSVGNFFAPVGGGFGFRAVYLKKRHGLSYTDYISTLAGNYIVVFLVNAACGLLALALLTDRINGQYWVLVTLFAAIFAATTSVATYGVPSKWLDKQKEGPLKQVLSRVRVVSDGWNAVASNRRLMGYLIGVTLVNFSLALLANFLILRSLGFGVSPPAMLLFTVLGSMSLFINITPANIGIKESVFLFSAAVIALEPQQVIAFALIDRGVLFVVLGLGWVVVHTKLRGRFEALVASKKA